MARILVADDEEGIWSFLAEALEIDGHDVWQAEDGKAALDTTLPGLALDAVGLARQFQPFAHFAERGAGLAGGVDDGTTFRDRFVFPALALGHRLCAPFHRIGRWPQLQLRIAVQFLG